MRLSRRRFNRLMVGSLGLLTLPPALADLVEGQDWRAISPPQPSDTPGKIEILEFFSYGCPHCSHLNPLLDPWARQLPADVTFRRVPVTFGRTAWANLARLYYALESSGDLERLNQSVFDALHQEHARLYTKPDILDWVAAKGVDTEKFGAVFDSFDIQTQVSRSDYLVSHYQIDGVPTITVAGRYAVLAKAAKNQQDMLTITDQLITKARTEVT